LQKGAPLGPFVDEGLHAQPDIGPVETLDHHARIAHGKPLHDLGTDGRRRRRGEGQHGRVSQILNHGAKPQVIGAEVVAPLADAVRLVDDEQGRLGRVDGRPHLVIGELLRSQEQEV